MCSGEGDSVHSSNGTRFCAHSRSQLPHQAQGGATNLVARPSLGANQVGELLFSSRGVRPAPQRAAESSHTRFEEGGLENTRVYILNSNRNHVFEG